MDVRPLLAKKSDQRVAESKSVDKLAPKPSLPTPKVDKSVAEVLASPQLQGLSARCWQMMLDAGWEVMAQANGDKLFKMPGVSFFDFQPNVNIFDSRDKACAQFLKTWIQSAASEGGAQSNQEELSEFVWPLMLASGWQTMASADETWYIMPNTPFDKCVPNETIFRGKEQAVARFLDDSGLGAPPSLPESQPEQPEEDSEVSSNDGTEVLDEDEEQQHVENSSQEYSSQDEPDIDSDNSEDESEEEDEEDEDDEIPTVDLTKAPKPKGQGVNRSSKTRKSEHPKAKRFVALSPEKSESSQRHSMDNSQTVKPPSKPASKAASKPAPKPEKVIPTFKLSFGKIEDELRLRGWYWQQGALDWHYYQPHCKDQALSKLKADKDYFIGREMLEEHLTRSGLIESIHEAQLLAHRRQFMSDDEHSDVEVPIQHVPTSQKAIKAKSQNKRRLPKQSSSSRKRQRSSKVPDSWEPNFGLIWEKLQEEGWHLKHGIFGYDYFKPTCQSLDEGTMGVDYFHSEEELTEYLRDKTAIWSRVARELKAEVAMGSDVDDHNDVQDDEAMEDDADECEDEEATEQQRGHKRRISTDEAENIFDFNFEDSSVSKRQRNSSEFRTPVAVKRPLAPSTTAVTVNTAAQDDSISPDAMGIKETEHVPTSAMPRNLANIFTPSPSNAKKSKPTETTASEMTPSPVKEVDPVSAAIKRLTASYTPRRFRYRESEFAEIRGFFRQCFMQRRGASLYISGAPGCGKTALLKSTEGDIDQLHKVCGSAGITVLAVDSHSLLV